MTPWGARFGSGVVLAIDTRAPCRATSLAGVARALGGVAAMSLANSVPLLALGTITLVQLSCYIEEWIFKALPGFKFHWFVALVELLLFAVAGRIGQGFSSPQPPRRGPLYLYAGVGFTLSLGTGLGKVAFRYLNYATGTVLKSMKLLPVLAISACWLKRQYTPGEVIAAVLMVISASLFGLGERELEPSFHPLGIALSFACLLAQAIQSNLQDALLRDRGCDVHEAMLYSNAMGFVFVFIITAASGELCPALVFFFSSSKAAALLTLRSFSFYFGALVYTMLLQKAGAVTAVAVGTVRKSLTVVLSFMLYEKPWSNKYGWGGVALIAAVVLEARAHHKRGGPPKVTGDPNARERERELQPIKGHASDSADES